MRGSFFTGYFDDKKRSEAFDAKRMEHEKSMAVIIAEATKTINGNQEIVKDITSELSKTCGQNDSIMSDLRHIVAQVDTITKTLKEG